MGRVNIEHKIQGTTVSHAGLWFDRYLRNQAVKSTKGSTANSKTEKEPRQLHIGETANIIPAAIYHTFYADWKQSLQSCGAIVDIMAQTQGRLSIGLGNESPIETAISLHHTYGVPFIPGSALKGLAAHYADRRLGGEWKKGTPAYEVLFGYTEKKGKDGEATLADAGYVTFFDALYEPDSGFKQHPLHPDIMTVHHPNYYNQDAPSAPADWDSPTPIPFLTASGRFLLALAGPEIWVKAVYSILAHALSEWGVGAKTSSGYGRMTLSGADWLPKLEASDIQTNSSSMVPVATAPSSPLDIFLARLQKLQNKDVAGQIQNFYGQWEKLPDEKDTKKRAALAILEKVRLAGKDKQFGDRAWYVTLLKFVE